MNSPPITPVKGLLGAAFLSLAAPQALADQAPFDTGQAFVESVLNRNALYAEHIDKKVAKAIASGADEDTVLDEFNISINGNIQHFEGFSTKRRHIEYLDECRGETLPTSQLTSNPAQTRSIKKCMFWKDPLSRYMSLGMLFFGAAAGAFIGLRSFRKTSNKDHAPEP